MDTDKEKKNKRQRTLQDLRNELYTWELLRWNESK